ncbi:MAG: hypothetical protein SGPRY_010120 [Prymnesium sp.]
MAPKATAGNLEARFWDDDHVFLCQPQNDHLASPSVAVQRWLRENEEKALKMRAIALELFTTRTNVSPMNERDEADLDLFGSARAFAADVASAVSVGREPQPPSRFAPDEKLRDHATGSRKRKRARDPTLCDNETCVAARGELADARVQVEKIVSEYGQLRDKLRALAEEAAGDSDAAGVAAGAMQLAILDILDDSRESFDECGGDGGEDSNVIAEAAQAEDGGDVEDTEAAVTEATQSVAYERPRTRRTATRAWENLVRGTWIRCKH